MDDKARINKASNQGSAELHSAVSPICNLRALSKAQAPLASERPPIKNRAKQQIENLRYP